MFRFHRLLVTLKCYRTNCWFVDLEVVSLSSKPFKASVKQVSLKWHNSLTLLLLKLYYQLLALFLLYSLTPAHVKFHFLTFKSSFSFTDVHRHREQELGARRELLRHRRGVQQPHEWTCAWCRVTGEAPKGCRRGFQVRRLEGKWHVWIISCVNERCNLRCVCKLLLII